MDEFPHHFESLRNPDCRTVVFCGAGMSDGIVPTAPQLYRDNRESAEAFLGLNNGECDGSHHNLYEWAECILTKLKTSGCILPKLQLAKALCITTDPRWHGDIGIDFRGNTPRHRVLARLAKEGRIKSFWSLNWDCVLEKALESVGLIADRPRFRTPWLVDHFQVQVTNEDIPESEHEKAIPVRKLHGCLTALRRALDCEHSNPELCKRLSERLMIADTELKDRVTNDVDENFFARLRADTTAHPSIIVGWAIAEKLIRRRFCDALRSINGIRVSIIDLTFQRDSHQEVCAAARQAESEAFFRVNKEEFPTVDDLFRWVQARFSFDRLEEFDGEIVDYEGNQWLKSLQVCGGSQFILDWSDEFLPTWVRLCWSAGLVDCYRFSPPQIDLERRDEHVPLSITNIDRPDLRAARYILSALPINGASWNAAYFPGGLYNENNRNLIVPLPCWKKFNELRALKPMMRSVKERIGFIDTIAIYPVMYDGNSPEDAVLEHLKQRLADLMPISTFADSRQIPAVYSLEEGALNE